MYEILFTKSAAKEYKKLPKAIKIKVQETLEILSINPLAEILKFKKIRGKENHYRIRLGDYRLIYCPLTEKIIVRVIRIGHRKDVYRHF